MRMILPNNEAGKNAFRLLEEAEKKRALRRFEHGLFELQQGRTEILGNREFTGRLPVYLYREHVNSGKEETEMCLQNLFGSICDAERGTEALAVLDKICELSLEEGNISLMQILCSHYVQVLHTAEGDFRFSEGMVEFLTKSCRKFAQEKLWHDFGNVISVLWPLRKSSYSAANGSSVSVSSIFCDVATRDVLENILRLYGTGNELQKASAARYMRFFGENAAVFLLNRLAASSSRHEHFLLTGLLATCKKDVVFQTLQSFLDKDLPRQALKNFILLVGEIGGSDHYRLVEEYLVYPDIPIQHLVVGCIVRLGGQKAEKRLLQALMVVENEVKLKLIKQLRIYCSEETGEGLVDMVKSLHGISSEIQEELLYTACITLRSFPYGSVMDLLRDLQKKYAHSEKLHYAIIATIQCLEPVIRHRMKEELGGNEILSYDHEPGEEEKNSWKIDAFVKEVTSMMQAGKIDEASSLFYKESLQYAQQKDFQSAEMLKDRLLKVNPNALQDVIRLSEIIEVEKSSPLSQLQRDLWGGLLESLSDGERDFLCSVWRNENYCKGEKIVSAGEIDPCLYFLEEGSIQLSCRNGNTELFLKRLKPGEVIGVGPFFSASVWTVNMTAGKNSRVLVLRRDLYAPDCKNYEHLEKRLFEFCRNRDSIHELVRISGSDRRDCARYGARMPLQNILLDPYGKSSGRRTFQGEMLDISRGGLSFSIRISSRENAQAMLGRQIVSTCRSGEREVLSCWGVVVGVYSRQENLQEFSVHVKFYSELEQRQLADVLNLAR